VKAIWNVLDWEYAARRFEQAARVALVKP
jgi:superoxide dismutase